MERHADREREAIIAVIEGETLAFFSRDYERWANYWVQAPSSRRLSAVAGGHIDYHEGWEVAGTIVTRIMEQFPEPNAQGARAMRRENYVVRLTSDMAWVSFDQYGPDTGDAFDSVGLSHQIRILEKQNGDWKIACIVSGETSAAYFAFPAVRVDRNGAISWMNDAARARLPHHPALMVVGGYLRARRRSDNKLLAAALAEVEALTPMQMRRSASDPKENRRTRAVVLDTDRAEVPSICWVSRQDAMLIVSFEDTESETSRIDAAGAAYALSPSQMRLARLIVSGQDTSAAAKSLGISASTARTQLQRIFDKTGVRSQTALVRALLSVEPPVG